MFLAAVQPRARFLEGQGDSTANQYHMDLAIFPGGGEE